MSRQKITQLLTLIVPFEVPAGQEDNFHQQWHDKAEALSHEPGFLSAQLYEISTEVEEYVLAHIPEIKWVGEQRFRFVNIAKWTSITDYEAAIRASTETKPISFHSYPAYYHLFGGFDSSAKSLHPQNFKTGQEFTFIAPFEVPQGQEVEMRSQFQTVVENMKQQQGALGPGLYELDIQAEARLRSFIANQLKSGAAIGAMFRFINVAEWSSVEHYEVAMRSRQQVEPISFPGYGDYYRIVAEYTRTTENI